VVNTEKHAIKFVARQAILDKNKNTYAYELLYRNSFENFYNSSSDEEATSQIIFQNHVFGDLNILCSHKKAFINFDESSLLAKLPLMLDRKTSVVEILETINVTEEIISAIKIIHSKGYVLALDDYDFSSKWKPLLPYISIIKIDREDIPFDKIASLKNSAWVTDRNIKIIVERIETHEQFEALRKIGIDYFQGYFFHKPEMNTGYFIEPVKLNLLLLFSEVHQPCLDFNSIAEIVSRDVSLINGTLKLVNVNAEKNRLEITSIKQAITFLGADKIKQFIAIITMSKLSSDSTSELLGESLIRGKMMEYLSSSSAFSSIKEFAFITGIMSHIGTILHCPIEKIITALPLAKEIKLALINKEGLLHEALEIVKSFENIGTRHDTNQLMIKHNILDDVLLNHYHAALKWHLITCN